MTNQTLHTQIRNQLQAGLTQQADDEVAQLNDALRLLSKWCSVRIQNTVLQNSGTVVQAGPLTGLDFIEQSAEGCHISKLLGCYEQPLLPFIEQTINQQYPTILNIGCAEDYYAVGMARRMADTQVMAYDITPVAQGACRQLAEKNSVQDRITIGELFDINEFSKYEGQYCLVLCDIEGGEQELLNPELAPALAGMDLIVESHEVLIPGITQTLIDRFKETHEITLVQDNGQRQMEQMPQWFFNLAHLDQLLAVWEWRSGATPWLVMKAKR